MNIRKFLYNNHWTLGFFEENISNVNIDTNHKVHWMRNPYKDRWFADPFILDVTDKEIIVIVEEFYDPINRGRISKLIVDRQSYQLKQVDVILELPTHLSFPAIIRSNNKVYIYPENSSGRGLDVYEYDIQANRCVKLRNITKMPLTDAVITNVFGKEYIFSTHLPRQNGNILCAYELQSDGCKLVKEISFPNNVARNAGDWFQVNNKVYRPAQDCTERYGGAVIIQEVKKNNDKFIFENIKKLDYTFGTYNLGCHTYNHYKGLSVIDINGYRRPLCAKLGLFIAKLRNRK